MATTFRLKRPAYTGSNRCWPCTVVNLVVLASVVAGIALFRLVPAVVVAVAGLVVIWLRGYLVPYTPRFAPKLVAQLPGDSFEHSSRSDSLEDVRAQEGDGEAVLEALIAAGVITVEGDQLGLEAEVAASWQARMAELSDSPERLAEAAEDEVAGIDSARIEDVDGETYVVVTGGSTAWLPEAVAVAEIGAVQVLRETALPERYRELAAHSLCAFLETCPVCDADVVEGPADDCCGHTVPDPSHDPPTVLACERCGVAFYTLEEATAADA